MFTTYVDQSGPVSSWFDCGAPLPLHSELGTRDQANIVRFDEHEEVLWVGTQRGRLLSYLVNLEGGHSAYSRFNADVKEERIIDLVTRQEGVISLTRSNVLFSTRGGAGHALLSAKALNRITGTGVGLSAIEQFYDSQLAVGTDGTRTLFYVDSMLGEIKTFVDLPHATSKIHSCRDSGIVAVGGTSGQLTIVDARAGSSIHRTSALTSTSAHPSEVTSIASSGHCVFTCGKRLHHLGTAPDVFLKVYDVRNMRQVVAVSVPQGASRVVASPVSSIGGVAVMTLSTCGRWQQGDYMVSQQQLGQLRNLELFHTDCFQPHSPDLEPTVVDWSVQGDLNAMLDSSGVVHMWGRSVSLDNQPFPYRLHPHLDLTSSTTVLMAPRQPVMPSFPNPLHAANGEALLESGLHHTRVYSDSVRDGTWLSWAGVEEGSKVFKRSTPLKAPVPLLPMVASNCRDWDSTLRYCPNTAGWKYNTILARANEKHSHFHHVSPGKAGRHAQHSLGALELDDALLEEPANTTTASPDETTTVAPPKRWKFTPVDYSVNHSLFPFAIYNKSSSCYRSGLENGQAQLDALNPVIQCLYNLWSPLKAFCKAHVCLEETCLVCELGFLFHMMDEARFGRARVCQPVRISRMWKRLFPATLGIVEIFTEMVNALTKRVAEISGEEEGNVVEEIFGPSFTTADTAATVITGDAAVVAVECSSQRGVGKYIVVNEETGEIRFPSQEGVDAEAGEDGEVPVGWVRMNLVSVIAHVSASKSGGPSLTTPRNGVSSGHHVAMCAVVDDLNTTNRSRAHSTLSGAGDLVQSTDPTAEEADWLLFNDFVVTESSKAEAAGECPVWRKPVLALYAHTDRLARLNAVHQRSTIPAMAEQSAVIAKQVLVRDVNLSRQTRAVKSFTPLTPEEVDEIAQGTFTVALDTEFVSIGFGAIEIREDGSREIGRPGDMAIGRVSVVRVKEDASDPLDRVPFIDHYVAMDEREVKDYVTRFSGIEPGDLDPETSMHWLTSSKEIYLKLRYLVDSGSRFIGHGLHTDFRIVNLWVPSTLVADTVELFHLPGQRFLSLKFLANRLLNQSIQTGVHCSVEDSRTALEIWRIHGKLKASGELDQVIKSLYETGRSSGWK